MPKVATVSVDNAKSKLAGLIERALRGEEVVLTRHGRPVARLVPTRPRRSERKLGTLRGKIRVAADFDAPLPDDVRGAFAGRDG